MPAIPLAQSRDKYNLLHNKLITKILANIGARKVIKLSLITL